MGNGASVNNPPSNRTSKQESSENDAFEYRTQASIARGGSSSSPSKNEAVVAAKEEDFGSGIVVENASVKAASVASAKVRYDQNEEAAAPKSLNNANQREENLKSVTKENKLGEVDGSLTTSADFNAPVPENESKSDNKSYDVGNVNINDEDVSQLTMQESYELEEKCCYFGDLDDDGLRSGKGLQRYESGDIYKGEWEHDKKHGHGIYRFADGSVYEGRFKNDSIHGNGVHVFDDGAMYAGRFKNDQQSGHGTYIFISGSMYQGQWKDNAMHGAGVYVYSNGDRYKGQFKDNEMHGVGVAKVNNGQTVKVGMFHNGKPADVKTTFHGSSLVIEIKGLEDLLAAKKDILKRAPTDRVVAYVANHFNVEVYGKPTNAIVEGSHLNENTELVEGEDEL